MASVRKYYSKSTVFAPVKSEDWNKFRPEYLVTEQNVNWQKTLGPLLAITAIALTLSFLIIRRLKVTS